MASASPRSKRTLTRRSSRRVQVEESGESTKSPFCQTCGGTAQQNREGFVEPLLSCSTCNISEHPTCLDFGEKVREAIRKYDWECQECKRCMICGESGQEDMLIMCDDCDRGCHTFCASPRLTEVPKGPWKCSLCKGKRISVKKLSQQPTCPQAGCSGEGNIHGNSLTHLTLEECPVRANILASGQRKTRGLHSQSLSETEKYLPHGATDLQSPRKKARTATVVTSPSASRGADRPRVKLLLSHKKKDTVKVVTPEIDPIKHVPFGGRLTDADADISICKPGPGDRMKFKKARAQAEKAFTGPVPEPTENERRSSEQHEGEEIFYAPAVPKIRTIQLGQWEINTWYSAPYPEEYNSQPHIYICEYCFKYMKSQYVAGRHKAKCPLRHPPGDEIYRNGSISVFEVDGRKNKIYCQNLCLLAKMFLDHKTLYYDVEPFLFYILTENDERGCHFVGYFSKEKRSSANYNLSCIVTLPICQRKGYGGLLIEFSYLLSRKEGRTGSPEKPLSDLGLVTYRRYWRRTVLRALKASEGNSVSIDQLSQITCMTPDDIIHTLHLLDMLTKNSHGHYVIRYPEHLVTEYLAAVDAKNMASVKPDLLRWTPMLFKAPVISLDPQTLTANDSGEADVANSSADVNGVGT